MKHISESIIGRRGNSTQNWQSVLFIPTNTDVGVFDRKYGSLTGGYTKYEFRTSNHWKLWVADLQDAAKIGLGTIEFTSPASTIYVSSLPTNQVKVMVKKMRVSSNFLEGNPEFKEITQDEYIKIIGNIGI